MDRNEGPTTTVVTAGDVALRKESVDRNSVVLKAPEKLCQVALRKESVDRNNATRISKKVKNVALRKESVDRNRFFWLRLGTRVSSLSARRAWIEIEEQIEQATTPEGRSPQGERG